MLNATRAERSRVEREHLEEQRTKAERPSRGFDARFELAFDRAPIGMALVDGEGRWLEVNDALCRITGYSRNELMASTLADLTVPDDVHLDAQPIEDMLSGRISSYQVEKRYRHAKGHHLWVLVSVSLVRDDNARPLYVISQVQDISKRKHTSEWLEYLVDHDFLTGLFNQRRFEQELAKEAQRVARYGFSGAVILIDLDNFKGVNDAFGHKAGDELLEAVAEALSHRMRQTDVLARVGGDEFAILLPQTGAEQADIVAEGIVVTVREHGAVGGEGSIRVTASVGVALFGDVTPAEIMDHADRAMYDAKAAGRDCFSVCTTEPYPRTACAASGRHLAVVVAKASDSKGE
jgi:diguanylate cyclase (GGDEF)-like protein/PAS domain S-box-containing protein